ncbi:MAG: FUSC family protein, partial [Actinomycetota bacterium]|nr:FUSC family protein [Actinomycetota bacterium]
LLGVVNGYFAAARTAALLAFVLPVTVAAPLSETPARLAGWTLAATVAIFAHMLLWPPRSRDTPRGDAARATDALADLAEAVLAGSAGDLAARATAASEAVDTLRGRFLAAPHRPTGPIGPTAALASLVDELDWLLSFLTPLLDAPHVEFRPDENRTAIVATIAALRASAVRLNTGDGGPDFAQLDAARDGVANALGRAITDLAAVPGDQAIAGALQRAFQTRTISYSARQVGAYALRATGAPVPQLRNDELSHQDDPAQRPRSWLEATWRLVAEHASPRSVWFRNSVRGAAGLAIAVFVAKQVGLQHGFWVALGTMSVLRSSALGTGSTIVNALIGTAAGILVGSILIVAIGPNELLMWAALPPAILLAAYAPRAISFAAGQAGFTLAVLVLFNLIQPTGWTVGLIRIEDVAIGFTISLGVGVLFWPRGAAALLRESLSVAYARAAEYVVVATRQLTGTGGLSVSENPARASTAAIDRLDDAYREYLAERSADRVNVQSAAALAAGAVRVDRAGQLIDSLERTTDRPTLARCGDNLDRESEALRAWYLQLADSLAHAAAAPPPLAPEAESRMRFLACVRREITGGDTATRDAALAQLWASQYLDSLGRLQSHLQRHALEPSTRWLAKS